MMNTTEARGTDGAPRLLPRSTLRLWSLTFVPLCLVHRHFGGNPPMWLSVPVVLSWTSILSALLNGDRDPLGSLGLRPPSKPVRIRRPILLGVSAMLCYALLVVPAGGWTSGLLPDASPLNGIDIRELAWILIAAAFPEELFFRGLLYDRCREEDQAGEIGAVVWTSVLFALSHLLLAPSSPAVLATFVPGLILGSIRAMQGGIHLPVVFHFCFNVMFRMLPPG